MKKCTFLAAMLITVLALHAQQRPYYTQYILNDFIINPALAGVEDYWDAKLSHRHQWVGLEGAPITTYATIHGPLSRSTFGRETPTTVHPGGQNPMGEDFYRDYTSTKPHFGLGFTVINDATGPLNRFAAYGTLAYHIPITGRTSISGGVSLGLQNMRLDATRLDFGAQYPVDPAVAGSGYLNQVKPDITLGVYLYSANYFIGVSAQQVVPEKVGFGNPKTSGDSIVITGKLVPHLFLQGGYRLLVSDDINFLPSVTVKYIDPLPVGFDVNVKFQYRDLLWVGGSYRPNDGYAAMLGLNISNTFNLGYSYDITTSRLNTVSRGTHEILVGFLLGNHYGDGCPRNVW